MTTLHQTASALVSAGKGILAADESVATMSARLTNTGVEPTAENRRTYRELLVSTPDLSTAISGVILCDETLRQTFADGTPFAVGTRALGILPGIKVDTGAKPLAGFVGETVTEGLDGLADRLGEYADLGAVFAKWRAVIAIGAGRPSAYAIEANAHALARYAAACQAAGVVPIVEPEVLMDGSHGIGTCREVTETVLRVVFDALARAQVDLRAIVLKPNMVVAGNDSQDRPTADDVAARTVSTLLRAVPEHVAGIAFLSGGQPPHVASANLAAMQSLPAPWPLTFSFGRALVDPALKAWAGDADRVADGQQALYARVRCNVAALAGEYSEATEREHAFLG